MLINAATILLVTLILGYAIVAADTWLHYTTTTISLQRSSVVPRPMSLYGRGLSDACNVEDTDGGTSIEALTLTSCMLSSDMSLGVTSELPQDAYRTLAKVSTSNGVHTASVGGSPVAFLGNASLTSDQDYVATTLAMRTQCTPITQACDLRRTNTVPDLTFKCSDALAGSLAATTNPPSGQGSNVSLGSAAPFAQDNRFGFFLKYFSSSAYDSDWWNGFQIVPMNPAPLTNISHVYFVVGAIVPGYGSLLQDKEVVAADNFYTTGAAILLGCNSTVVDLSYSWTNGSVEDPQATISNGTTQVALQYPLHYAIQAYDDFTTSLRVAGFEASAVDFPNSFALAYSTMVMSIGSSSTKAAPTIRESNTSIFLATRLPKAPFWTLMTLNLLYILLGLVMAAIAFISAKRHPIKGVQMRLGIQGLVAALLLDRKQSEACVEDLDELFINEATHSETRDRVAVLPTPDGGWTFSTIRSPGALATDNQATAYEPRKAQFPIPMPPQRASYHAIADDVGLLRRTRVAGEEQELDSLRRESGEDERSLVD